MYGVHKDFNGEIEALSDINLQVEKRAFVFLVGPSGAGKSTLLSLLYRGAVPTKGQIYVCGKNVNRLKWGEIPMFRRNIGVVFQDFGLLEEKTVYENVAFALEVTEMDPKEIYKKVMRVLEKVRLSKRADAFPKELSGGEQQRVSIARAIVNDPLLLLGDEPTGNLDPDTSDEIMDLLSEINYGGTTILMATHNKAIVDRMKKRVVELEAGRIIRDERRGGYDNEL